MGWRKGDADPEDVRVTRTLVRLGPVLGRPLLEGLGRVVRVDTKEAVRCEEVVGDVLAVVGVRLHVDTAKRR